MKRLLLAAVAAATALAGAAEAQPRPKAAPATQLTWTTLGTNSGPIPNPHRAESANLLRYGDTAILVDVGDGAALQLSKAGLLIGAPKTLVISHLHFDHTGGLFALLGQRRQGRNLEPLTIYGPRGTKSVVDGLWAASREGNIVAGAIIGADATSDAAIRVIELGDGETAQVGPIKITAAANSHYQTLPPARSGSPAPVSLSFRFDGPGRSIAYTGDTGPSPAVEALARGADLLVSEIMDPKLALRHIVERAPNPVPPAVLKVVEEHFGLEHLSPDEVGKLAERAGVKALVLTHDALEDEEIPNARKQIGAHFKGPVSFARDLDSF